MKTQLKKEIEWTPGVSNHVKCKLMSVKCHRASERGGDEIYLKVENKKIWPTSPFTKIKTSEEIIVDTDVISDERGFIRIDL